MRVRRLLAFALAPLSAALLAVACSSVPDLSFVDGVDAGSDAREGGSIGSGSGGLDATTDRGAPATDCADGKSAPPNSICCGTTPCVGCEQGDCSDCDGTCTIQNKACCKRGRSAIRCGAVDTCK